MQSVVFIPIACSFIPSACHWEASWHYSFITRLATPVLYDLFGRILI